MHYQSRKTAIGLCTPGRSLNSGLYDHRSQTSDKARNGAMDVLLRDINEGDHDSSVEEDT